MSSRSPRLAACIGSLLGAGAPAAEQPAPLDATRVSEVMLGAQVRSVQPVPVAGGLYEVIDERSGVYYLDGAARNGFQCQLCDVAARRNLTQ
jgi:hypothetical protein